MLLLMSLQLLLTGAAVAKKHASKARLGKQSSLMYLKQSLVHDRHAYTLRHIC